ncbi:MAG: hypothetical protein MUD16_04755 [Desulfobacterales bacterium]|jgi:hypothetical protein|nr:hypothetical protein [Desulfobacterales bacterium]
MNSSYQSEQLQALCLVHTHLAAIPRSERDRLQAQIADYMAFRRRVDDFLEAAFGAVCSATCYRSRLSACCSREGIVTFFADMVINLLHSEQRDSDRLFKALQTENTGFKCVYLGPAGCLWRVKPIVCQMFLCDPAKAKVFGSRPDLETQWADFERERKRFTWPDRPVLFDRLEAYFISIGCSSPLMYLHQSPGLLRVKRRAGL